MLDALGPNLKVVKRLSDTRWSARADAINALSEGYLQIQEALSRLSEDPKQDRDTANEARSLNKKLDKLETVFLTILWKDIYFADLTKSVKLYRPTKQICPL